MFGLELPQRSLCSQSTRVFPPSEKPSDTHKKEPRPVRSSHLFTFGRMRSIRCCLSQPGHLKVISPAICLISANAGVASKLCLMWMSPGSSQPHEHSVATTIGS